MRHLGSSDLTQPVLGRLLFPPEDGRHLLVGNPVREQPRYILPDATVDAFHLVPIEGGHDLRGAAVAVDHLDRTAHLHHELGTDAESRARGVAAAGHGLTALDQVRIAGADAAARAPDAWHLAGAGASQHTHGLEIEIRHVPARQLALDEPGMKQPQGQTVRLGLHGPAQTAKLTGARNVAHDEGRVAGKMLAHVTGHQPGEHVVTAARGRAHDDLHRLGLEKLGQLRLRALRPCARGDQQRHRHNRGEETAEDSKRPALSL